MMLSEMFEKRAKLYQELAALDTLISEHIKVAMEGDTKPKKEEFKYAVGRQDGVACYAMKAGPFDNLSDALAYTGTGGDRILKMYSNGITQHTHYWSDSDYGWKVFP